MPSFRAIRMKILYIYLCLTSPIPGRLHPDFQRPTTAQVHVTVHTDIKLAIKYEIAKVC
jgi:hypothetical protein